MSNKNPQTPITESLVREVISSYNKLKGEYRLNALKFRTADEIIAQITKDLNNTDVENKR
jgi:hypothetical protein